MHFTRDRDLSGRAALRRCGCRQNQFEDFF
jgi:hypothetical protein